MIGMFKIDIVAQATVSFLGSALENDYSSACFTAWLGSCAAIDKTNSELFYLLFRAVTETKQRNCPTLLHSVVHFCWLWIGGG